MSSLSRATRQRYRAWDGSQAVQALTPEQVLSALQAQLLGVDPERVLSQALHRGLTTAEEQLEGLDQQRARLRQAVDEAQVALAEQADSLELLRALGERAGGDGGLTGQAERLLDAVAANPSQAGSVISAAGAQARTELRNWLEQLQQGATPGGATDGTAAFAFSAAHLARLLELSELEGELRRVRQVQDVLDIDDELVRRVLGERAAEQLAALGRSLAGFEESGYVPFVGRRRELSARAVQQIGAELLQATLRQLRSYRPGDHRDPRAGLGLEHSGTSRDYQFGDPFDLNLSQTVLTAVKRRAGAPVLLAPSDLTIFEREESSRMATVLAVDLSRSMGERGYLLAAKRLALALGTLIRTRFPRDELLLIGFSETARPLELGGLAALGWDRCSFGTNVQDAVRLARTMLERQRGMQRNLLLITDGEPTAYREAGGAPRFSHPATAETLAATYAEAERCRRERIVVTVVLLSEEQRVVKFADEFSRRAGGSVIVSDPLQLDAAVLLRYGALRATR